jgi:hypothetical protein
LLVVIEECAAAGWLQKVLRNRDVNRAMIALGGRVDDVSEWEVACDQWSCSLLRWALIVCKVKVGNDLQEKAVLVWD